MTVLDDAINDVCHLRRRLDEAKQERDAAIARAEKAEAFKKEWEDKDGNSPGYNLQKAETCGAKAAEHRETIARLAGLLRRYRSLGSSIELNAEAEAVLAEVKS